MRNSHPLALMAPEIIQTDGQIHLMQVSLETKSKNILLCAFSSFE